MRATAIFNRRRSDLNASFVGAIESGDAGHVNFYTVILEMDLRRKQIFSGGVPLLPIVAAAQIGHTGVVEQLMQCSTLTLITSADLNQLAQRANAERDVHFRNRLVMCHNLIADALSANKTSKGLPRRPLPLHMGLVDLAVYRYSRLVHHGINVAHKTFSSPATDRFLDGLRHSFQDHLVGIIMFILVGLLMAKIRALLDVV